MRTEHPLKKKVLDYYFTNDVTYEQTVNHFNAGFSLQSLMRWTKSDNRFISKRKKWHFYSEEVKLKAIELYFKENMKPSQIKEKLGINTESSVRFWIRQYNRYGMVSMSNKRLEEQMKKIKRPKQTDDEKDKLIYQLQLENDVLREVFKLGGYPKAQGLKVELLTVKQKTLIVNALRPKYQFLNNLLDFLHLEKSAYDYSRKTTKKQIRDKSARDWVLHVFNTEPKAKGSFGYRQVYYFLRNIGVKLSEKVIQKWMKKLALQPKVKRCRKYYSYMGQIGHIAPNLIKRRFKSKKPNQKWLTDITEFHFNGIKVYLSWVIDCFNGEIVAYTISKHPNMELVLNMMDKALSTLKKDDFPIIHSDMGHHYQRPKYVEKLKKSKCRQSMSKKGCSPDNSACEGSFGIMKVEFFHNKTWENTTYEEFTDELNDWIDWFNKERAKPALNGLSPVRYRVNHQKHIMFNIEPTDHMDAVHNDSCKQTDKTVLKIKI